MEVAIGYLWLVPPHHLHPGEVRLGIGTLENSRESFTAPWLCPATHQVLMLEVSRFITQKRGTQCQPVPVTHRTWPSLWPVLSLVRGVLTLVHVPYPPHVPGDMPSGVGVGLILSRHQDPSQLHAVAHCGGTE